MKEEPSSSSNLKPFKLFVASFWIDRKDLALALSPVMNAGSVRIFDDLEIFLPPKLRFIACYLPLDVHERKIKILRGKS